MGGLGRAKLYAPQPGIASGEKQGHSRRRFHKHRGEHDASVHEWRHESAVWPASPAVP